MYTNPHIHTYLVLFLLSMHFSIYLKTVSYTDTSDSKAVSLDYSNLPLGLFITSFSNSKKPGSHYLQYMYVCSIPVYT